MIDPAILLSILAEVTATNPAIYLSVFGAIIATGLFWGGYNLGTIRTRLHNQESKDFVPRKEFDISLKNIETDIGEIKENIRAYISEQLKNK